MNMYDLTLGSARMQLRGSRALWWPDQATLVVSDLHLGKSERVARRGGSLLPPYETTETLSRLRDEIDATQPKRVVCLGDSFDDRAAAASLDAVHKEALAVLMSGRDWVWVEGNHDPGPLDVGGRHAGLLEQDGVTLRHIAARGDNGAEVSGHYHPKAGLHGRGGRACFLTDGQRLILPAFGAYTGGLHAGEVARLVGLGDGARAVLAGRTMACLPVQIPQRTAV